MIKRLQIRVVALTMLSLLIVLAGILIGMNVVNYKGVVHDADNLLMMLSDNKGHFPKDVPPDMKGKPLHGASPELPYETRYFSVLIDESGAAEQVETGNIAAVDDDTAVNYAQEAMSRDAERGFIKNYRYIRRVENEEMRIVFLDCGRKMDSVWNFLLASCGISLAGYMIVFLLVVFFSSKIIRPIAESYEKQKRFITDAGHELKTPLTIIHADADVLEIDIGKNEWLEDIQKQVSRLSALTNNLVYLARMEEAEDSLQMIEFPVSDVVMETVSSFHALAQMQNKRFVAEIQPMLSMKGDEKAIQQLVSILLDNALKYSPSESEVSIKLERQGKNLRMVVSNETGDCVSKEELQHFFDRFYRADPSRNSQTSGYGIGLSLAKAVVTAHNGKIQASTQDEQSLQMTVTIPM